MLTLRVFGVGDGDCILIEFPDGRLALVDSCIPSGQLLPPVMPWIQHRTLAFCCLTHPHGDHFTGMRDILSEPSVTTNSFWFALSDLDVVLESLHWTAAAGIAAAAGGRAAEEARLLYDLFEWVEARPPGFARQITGIHYTDIAGVEILAFGPRAEDWDRYRRGLARQRGTGQPISRARANAISIALLLKYAGHAIWLLSDLTAPSLRRLPGRAAHSGIPAAVSGVLASVLKVPHHAARNAWFPLMSEALTRCKPEDVIVISASGGVHHPNAEVLAFWQSTRKRVVATYDPAPVPPAPLLPGLAGVIAAQVARPTRVGQPKHLIISIPPVGPISAGRL